MVVRDRNFGDVGNLAQEVYLRPALFSSSLFLSLKTASTLNVICPSFRIAATRMEQHPDQARLLLDFCESSVIRW